MTNNSTPCRHQGHQPLPGCRRGIPGTLSARSENPGKYFPPEYCADLSVWQHPGQPAFFLHGIHARRFAGDILQKQGTLDPETAISYGMQVALGLSEAFKKNVVHMDIKPST